MCSRGDGDGSRGDGGSGRGDGSRGDGGSGYLPPIEVVRKGVQQLELLRVSRLRTRRW